MRRPGVSFGGMKTPDNPDRPTPEEDRPDPTKLAPTLGHLMLRDTPTPEEKLAASLRESARRKGRGRVAQPCARRGVGDSGDDAAIGPAQLLVG